MKKIVWVIVCIISCCQISKAQTELWGMTSVGGQYMSGTIFKTDSSGNNQTVQQSFVVQIEGSSPGYAQLIQASDGKLYGMTTYGGVYGGVGGMGVLFQYDPATSTYTKKLDFAGATTGSYPCGSLMQASDGKLYGMTPQGGANNMGVLFQFDPITSTYTKKLDFAGTTNGNDPTGSLMQASDGNLYGMTRYGGANNAGVLFQYDPITSTYTNKLDFSGSSINGSHPSGSLIQASDGKLYGMTTDGGANTIGVLFQYDPVTSVCAKKLDFSSATSGGNPLGSLIQASDGKLYGLTDGGGAYGQGVLFQYDPSTSISIKKFDFAGTTNGANPQGSLMQASDGKLYGMTKQGGANHIGVLFQYDPATSSYTNKLDFAGTTNGSKPWGSLMQASDGKLYGMTTAGGVNNLGVLFQYDPATSTYTNKLDIGFEINGANPQGSLMQASDGKLYGMTKAGGVNNLGVLFQYIPATATYTKKLDFAGATNGSTPYGTLMQASDGKLYGMTEQGGANNLGVLFQFDPATSTYTNKLDFAGATNGSNPYGSLMQANDGKLYGVTKGGGTNNMGVLFQYDPATSTYTKKLDFTGATNGSTPYGSLMQASDGKLYGMTQLGGVNNLGVLFQYDPAASTYTKKFDFAGLTNGSKPQGSLMQASNGKLYGMTSQGGVNNMGVLFKYDPDSSKTSKQFDFASLINGNSPFGSLMQAKDGKLYGTTAYGGANGRGVLFQYDPGTSIYTKKLDFAGLTNGDSPVADLIEITVLASTSTTVCVGNSVVLTASGASTYTWNTGATTPTISVTPITNTSYTVTGTAPAGYTNTAVSTVTAIALPLTLVSVSSATTCAGSSTILQATGASTYSWNTGGTISTISVMPSANTSYTVIGTNTFGCSNSQTVGVTVDNTCQDVWPGDANSDGIADNIDILELGLHYTQTGTPRATTSNLWQSYYSANWSDTITNGKNVNHSDCNGDGIINDDDTLAIFNNYNLIHAFKPAQTTTNPAVTIVPDQSSVVKGTWGTSSVYLGDATTTISNINGIAYTINYDNTLFETDSVWIEYPTSFINASNQNLKFLKRDFTNGKLYTATTHTISGNVSGNGKIATLHYKIKSSLTTDNVLNLSISDVNQSDASGVITPLTAGSATLTALGTSITTNLNALTNGNYISLHPNPTNGALIINSTTELQKIDVMAITGQLLISEVPLSINHVLHLDHLANGVYFVNLYQNNRIVKREKIILNK